MINCLIEIDVIARRYNLNPVDLLFTDCENEFLRLAYIRKIAEIGIEQENKAYEQAQRNAPSS